MLVFEPVRTEDDVLKDLIKLKNKQNVLKIKENKLIDELLTIKGDENVQFSQYYNRNHSIYNNNDILVFNLELEAMMREHGVELDRRKSKKELLEEVENFFKE